MFPASEYAVWLESSLFSGYVFFLGFKLGLVRRFRFLHFYLFCTICVGPVEALVLRVFDVTVLTRLYWYFCSELLLSVSLYLAIVELYRLKLPRNVWHSCRLIFVAIPALLILFSVVAARGSAPYGLLDFNFRLSDYVFFPSLALTFVLWGISCMTVRAAGIAARMIQAWGVYFLLVVLVHDVRQLSPHSAYYSATLASLNAAWLPVALGYAMVNGLEFGV